MFVVECVRARQSYKYGEKSSMLFIYFYTLLIRSLIIWYTARTILHCLSSYVWPEVGLFEQFIAVVPWQKTGFWVYHDKQTGSPSYWDRNYLSRENPPQTWTLSWLSRYFAFLLVEISVLTFPQRVLKHTPYQSWGGGEGVIQQLEGCPVPGGVWPSLHAPTAVEIVYQDQFILPRQPCSNNPTLGIDYTVKNILYKFKHIWYTFILMYLSSVPCVPPHRGATIEITGVTQLFTDELAHLLSISLQVTNDHLKHIFL